MTRLPEFYWSRLALAILAAAALSLFFKGFFAAGFLLDQKTRLVLGYNALLMVLIQFFYVTPLYLISLAGAKNTLSAFVIFALLFLILAAGWSFLSLRGYSALVIGGQNAVTDHQLTAFGWHYWQMGALRSAAEGFAAAIILFAGTARRRRRRV